MLVTIGGRQVDAKRDATLSGDNVTCRSCARKLARIGINQGRKIVRYELRFSEDWTWSRDSAEPIIMTTRALAGLPPLRHAPPRYSEIEGDVINRSARGTGGVRQMPGGWHVRAEELPVAIACPEPCRSLNVIRAESLRGSRSV
jgi:hypothetical protein